MPEHTVHSGDNANETRRHSPESEQNVPASRPSSALGMMAQIAGDEAPFDRHDVMVLQRTVGNKATAQIVARQRALRQSGSLSRTAPGVLQRFEARMHESIETVGLTTDEQGGAAGLSREESNAVYFGNWMRDVNQVFVPVVEGMGFGPNVVFPIMNYLATKKFGRSMTPEQFGYYVPAEHMDNPAGLVNPTSDPHDGGEDLYPDQPQIDTAGRVQGAPPRPAEAVTRQEDVSPAGQVGGMGIFEVDQNAVMGFIRRSNEHVERRLRLAAQRGRNPEGMIHLGAALHSVEDLFAHSNFVEIAVERFLRDNQPILQQLFPDDADRQRYGEIYNFAPDMNVRPNDSSSPTGRAASQETRPVLTTGSFASTDTQISIGSELGTILGQPLPPARSVAEQDEEDRMVRVLLQQLESQLRNDPAFRRGLREIIGRAGGGQDGGQGDLIDQALQNAPLVALYDFSNYIVLHLIPDEYRLPVKNYIRNYISTGYLQPMGQQLQASGLDARVASSSQIQNLQEQQRVARGEFTATEQETMQATARGGGASVAEQTRERQTGGQRHADALEATPGAVIAGPSHSQIAKDHANSPFFGIGFALATQAVRMLREKMVAAWDAEAGESTRPYDFGWNNFPADESGLPEDQRAEQRHARDLFHQTRPQRNHETDEAFNRGHEILEHGGMGEQPYRLSEMREQDADDIRGVAEAMRTVADSPGRARFELGRLRRILGDDTLPAETERIRERIQQAEQSLGQMDQGIAANRIRQIAGMLDGLAQQIQEAQTYDQREAVRHELETLVGELLLTTPGVPAPAQNAIAQVLVILNRHVGQLSPTYMREQRAFTEAVDPRTGQVRTDRQGHPTASIPGLAHPRALQTGTYAAPPLPQRGALRDLLEMARRIMDHPYQDRWWEPIVRQYISQHPEQIRNDIMARNEGVPFFRRPGESGGHHH